MDDIAVIKSGIRKFAAIQILIIWLSLLIPVTVGYIILINFPIILRFPWFFLLIPLCIALIFLTVFSALIVAVIALKICNRRYPPREGSFDIDLSIGDMRGWMYRRNIKALTNSLSRSLNINTLKIFILRAFGIKIGKNAKLYGTVLDDPFIKIGDNFILGRRSVVAGHLYDHYKITFNKTIIGNNVIIEQVAGAVGAILGDNVIIRKGSGALRGQKTRGDGIFRGVPVSRIGKYSDLTSEELDKVKQFVKSFNKCNVDKEKISPIKINSLKLNLFKILIVSVGLLAAAGIGVLLYFTLFSLFYFIIGGLLGTLLAILFTPFFILIILGFFLAFSAIITKYLISPVPEGTYELDSKEAQKWKFSYLLKKFCISLVHATVLDIADVFVLKLFGNKIRKNVILKEGIVDPEYLELGDYVI
ncbi:MAG: hypothetical protein ACFFD2_03800, partial [Promethearchaeota archaeon]